MNQLTTLEEGKKLLSSIRNQYLWCMKHRKGYTETEWAREELNNIEIALTTIKTSAEMSRFLERKETVLRLLMPARKTTQHQRLRELVRN